MQTKIYEGAELKYQSFLSYFFCDPSFSNVAAPKKDEKKALEFLKTGTLIKTFDSEVTALLKDDVERRMNRVGACIKNKMTMTAEEWERSYALASFSIQQGIFKAKDYEGQLKTRSEKIMPYLRQYTGSQAYAEAEAEAKEKRRRLYVQKSEKSDEESSSEDFSEGIYADISKFDVSSIPSVVEPEEVTAEQELFGNPAIRPDPADVLQWLQHVEQKLDMPLTPDEAERARDFMALLQAYASHQGIGDRLQDFAKAEKLYQQAMLGHFNGMARNLYAQMWLDNPAINPSLGYQQATHYLSVNENGSERRDEVAKMYLGTLYLKKFAAGTDKEKVSTQWIALCNDGIGSLLSGLGLVSAFFVSESSYKKNLITHVFAIVEPNQLVDFFVREFEGKNIFKRIFKNWEVDHVVLRIIEFLDKGIQLGIPEAMYVRAALNHKMVEYIKQGNGRSDLGEPRAKSLGFNIELNPQNKVSTAEAINLLGDVVRTPTASALLVDAALKYLENLSHSDELHQNLARYTLFELYAFGAPAIAKDESKALAYLQEGSLFKTIRPGVLPLIQPKSTASSPKFDANVAIFILNHQTKFEFVSDDWAKKTVIDMLNTAERIMSQFKTVMEDKQILDVDQWDDKRKLLLPVLQLDSDRFVKFPELQKRIKAVADDVIQISLYGQGQGKISKRSADDTSSSSSASASTMPTTTAASGNYALVSSTTPTSTDASATPMAAILASASTTHPTVAESDRQVANVFNTIKSPEQKVSEVKAKMENEAEENGHFPL